MFISHMAQSQWKGGSGVFQGPWQALNPRTKGMNIVLTSLWCFNDLPNMLAFNFFFILYTQAFTVLKFGPLMTILGCFWASSTALCMAQKREPTQHCHLMSLAVQAICSGSWHSHLCEVSQVHRAHLSGMTMDDNEQLRVSRGPQTSWVDGATPKTLLSRAHYLFWENMEQNLNTDFWCREKLEVLKMLESLFQMWPALKAHANLLDLDSFNFLVDVEFVELVTVVHADSGTT